MSRVAFEIGVRRHQYFSSFAVIYLEDNFRNQSSCILWKFIENLCQARYLSNRNFFVDINNQNSIGME